MQGRRGARMLNAGRYLAAIAWFVCAVTIATQALGVEPGRGNLWVVILIFLAPLALIFILDELVHWIRTGRQAPGRHSRGDDR